jgi:hypothetical protein
MQKGISCGARSRIPRLILLATLQLAPLTFAITRGSNDASTPEAAIVVQVLNPNGSCTGTLLTPTAVLTAKHCVTGTNFGSNGSLPAAQQPFTVLVGNPIGNGTAPIETHTTIGATVYGDNGPLNDQEHGSDVAILWLNPAAPRGDATAPAFNYARIVRQNLASPAPSNGDDSEGGHYNVSIGVAGWSPISGHDVSYRQVAYYSNLYHYPGYPDGGPGTPSGQFWVHGQGAGNVEPGDSGGPLFWEMADGTRQVLGVTDETFRGWFEIDGFDCTFNRCDIWTDVTRGAIANWIRQQLVDTSRSSAWLRSHGRTDYWKGEVDYTGPCDRGRDSACPTMRRWTLQF